MKKIPSTGSQFFVDVFFSDSNPLVQRVETDVDLRHRKDLILRTSWYILYAK